MKSVVDFVMKRKIKNDFKICMIKKLQFVNLFCTTNCCKLYYWHYYYIIAVRKIKKLYRILQKDLGIYAIKTFEIK